MERWAAQHLVTEFDLVATPGLSEAIAFYRPIDYPITNPAGTVLAKSPTPIALPSRPNRESAGSPGPLASRFAQQPQGCWIELSLALVRSSPSARARTAPRRASTPSFGVYPSIEFSGLQVVAHLDI